MSVNRNQVLKIEKIILWVILLVFSCSFFKKPYAKIYDEVYWSKRIGAEYSDKNWTSTSTIACFQARASVLDAFVKQICEQYSMRSLRYSWNLPGLMSEQLGLDYETNECVGVSYSDYEILSNLKNMRDAYSMISFSLESANRNRRYSI